MSGVGTRTGSAARVSRTSWSRDRYSSKPPDRAPLARAYDVPLDDLVGAPRTGDPRIHLKPLRRFGMVFVPLSRRPGGTQAFKMVIPAPLEPAPRRHRGAEWLYVLNGRLRLVGERDLTLPPGGTAEFDTSSPHWLGSADGGAVELLVLFGPEGAGPEKVVAEKAVADARARF